ncbi:protein ARABIDILLO 1, partial [Tanacetum coccineum]
MFTQNNMSMDESIQVASIIDKLPSTLKDVKKNLKHRKDDLSLKDLESHHIEKILKHFDSFDRLRVSTPFEVGSKLACNNGRIIAQNKYAKVALARSCLNAASGLQERAAGALWGLSVSEPNSIAIGREGGVTALIALAQSENDVSSFLLSLAINALFYQDVHETAAGALWNLAFNPGNALRIVEDGGVPTLVNLCSSSSSTMARFMAALALAYMFDG